MHIVKYRFRSLYSNSYTFPLLYFTFLFHFFINKKFPNLFFAMPNCLASSINCTHSLSYYLDISFSL